MSQFDPNRGALGKYFQDNWITAPATPRTLVEWPNHEIVKPELGDTSIWIRYMNKPGETKMRGINSQNTRTLGFLYFQMFQRFGQGTSAMRLLADEVAKIMNCKQIPDGNNGWIRTFTVSFVEVGMDQASGFYQCNAVLRYIHDAKAAA